MHKRFAAAFAALALLSATLPAAAVTIFPANGGSGVASFDDRCPAHQFLIGLAGHAAEWVGRIQIVCAPILPNGTHGEKYYGPSHGGGGGSVVEMSCPADSVVYGAKIWLAAETTQRLLRVDLLCGSMQADRQSITYFTGEGGDGSTTDGYYPAAQQCPTGELGSGFNGHYGKDVNAMGLDYADRSELAVPTTQAPSAQARPIKLTGKPNLVCPQGYVWREASPSDHVCVTPSQRRIAAAQNATAAAHVNQTDQTYGPNTCVSGYVWREAYVGDVVCVMPTEREFAKNENAQAPPQIPK